MKNNQVNISIKTSIIIAFGISLFPLIINAQPIEKVFDKASNLYLENKIPEAKNQINIGLAKSPNNQKLIELKKLIEEEEKNNQQDQQQQQQQQEQKDQQQQKQQQDQKMSQEEAQRMLDAIQNRENETKDNLQKVNGGKNKNAKDW